MSEPIVAGLFGWYQGPWYLSINNPVPQDDLIKVAEQALVFEKGGGLEDQTIIVFAGAIKTEEVGSLRGEGWHRHTKRRADKGRRLHIE